MIEMENVTKSFPLPEGKVDILKGISLYVGKGEFVSIMGPSGSGKSTLSSILGCLSSPSSGTFKLDGEEVTKLTPRNLATLRNRKIGFIFQEFNLLEGLTAVENVALPLFYAGVSVKERRLRAESCLKSVGLADRMYHTPGRLSGGQKQRVAIARALVGEPAFLFADEPTGALDKNTGREIMGLIQKLNLSGHTVVQVTHSAIDAQFSKRILTISDGLIVKDELVERPTIGGFGEGESAKGGELESRLWRVVQAAAPKAEGREFLNNLLARSKGESALIEAARALGRHPGNISSAGLRELFAHSSWAVRAEVLRSLSDSDPALAGEVCIIGLEDGNSWVRFLSISRLKRSLGSITEATRPKILARLEDVDERVRASAVTIVGTWADSGLLTALVKATDDRDGRVRANGMEALLPILKRGNPPAQILEVLQKHLGDPNNRARANASVLLYPHRPDKAFRALSEMLVSPNNLMRASGAWAMGQLPSDAGGALLTETLRSEKEELVLEQAVRSLAKLSAKYLSLQGVIDEVLRAA